MIEIVKISDFEHSKFEYGEIVLESISGRYFTTCNVELGKGSQNDIFTVKCFKTKLRKKLKSNELVDYDGLVEYTISLKGDFSQGNTFFHLIEGLKITESVSYCKASFLCTQTEFNELMNEHFLDDYPLKIIGVFTNIPNLNDTKNNNT